MWLVKKMILLVPTRSSTVVIHAWMVTVDQHSHVKDAETNSPKMWDFVILRKPREKGERERERERDGGRGRGEEREGRGGKEGRGRKRGREEEIEREREREEEIGGGRERGRKRERKEERERVSEWVSYRERLRGREKERRERERERGRARGAGGGLFLFYTHLLEILFPPLHSFIAITKTSFPIMLSFRFIWKMLWYWKFFSSYFFSALTVTGGLRRFQGRPISVSIPGCVGVIIWILTLRHLQVFFLENLSLTFFPPSKETTWLSFLKICEKNNAENEKLNVFLQAMDILDYF